MYLMNVPPVAARQTEWRTCGPPGGYSLPVCFNDSDPELSTRGTPISDKVQMIIESLRSTQSSLEMGDEIEGNIPPGQEVHPQVCKVAMGSYVGAKSKTKSPTENQQADVSCPINHKSSDSDSDSSVDRGIEEAILEYLKEKDDHKRKAEPCFPFLESSNIPRKSPPLPDVSKQNSDTNTFLIASSQFPKSVKAETPTSPAVIPIKKYIKNKISLNENTANTFDFNKSSTTKSLVMPPEPMKIPSKTINLFNKAKCPVKVKVEEDSNDSSSDDGIEEAIQRYQLEKKEQQDKPEPFIPHALKEESDSTSDDGIEEAIRSYQLEQLKEKSVLNPFLHKPKHFTKSLLQSVGSMSTEKMKKKRLRKKKTVAEKEVKSVQTPSSSIFIPKNTLSGSSKGKGNELLLFQVEGFKEQLTTSPSKINTTAELMCAEAILDISKTVMPEVFHHSLGHSSCTPTESSVQSSPPGNCPDEESDGSSIDSEDGIEQEIKNFLEQKAQMLKQPPTANTQEPQSINEPETAKEEPVATQKKPLKLSLTQRRKQKEANLSISNPPRTDDNVEETATKASPERGIESSPLLFSQSSQIHQISRLIKREQSGDKSSSLDSDEDLDTAIKDLLKTKKKTKKKRDLKRKSRLSLTDGEPLLGNNLETKKLKIDPISIKVLQKVEKRKVALKDKSGLSKNRISQTNTSKDMHEGELTAGVQATLLPYNTQTAVETKEDSSSVDSDDSIELEIRRFLAEKAKVSTTEKSKDEDVSRNGTTAVCAPLQERDIKQENQQAEIPSPGQSPFWSQPLPTPQGVMPDISAVGAQSHLSCGPTALEPADGVARTEQMRPTFGKGIFHNVTPQIAKVRPVLSPNIAHSRSEANKWRQSFGLPITDSRMPSRTPFHITSSKISETSSASPAYQSEGPKSQTPGTVWSSARTSRAPLPCSTETNVNATFRSPGLSLLSTARQHPRVSFTQRSQFPIEGETESMVHISKDKSVFVELESNRTNHVQVRSRERSEGNEKVDLLREMKRESESMEIDDKEEHLERKEEDFIDETDCESGNTRNPGQKQGYSDSSLSSAIDPGITFRPCIALTTEDRVRMFDTRFLTRTCKKGVPSYSRAPVYRKAVECVKRKLQFIPVDRNSEASSHHSVTK
ncbi:Protein phosphatase 1 regulatory subunit 26 [Dissostichus eleginoides]|uniref:Protein phosphatase 1 regulatory subunit 26 n=1 Tax=Dissostichus eleginoides TaxID=100907 RepID=A0AAD9EZU0_DISEL|nr:Protein phosphatase 1 regulatory subunit 26 [Dissostichus eleginoides]